MQFEDWTFKKQQLATAGFTVIEHVFTDAEMNSIATKIAASDTSRPAFRKTKDLFAICKFLKEIPLFVR